MDSLAFEAFSVGSLPPVQGKPYHHFTYAVSTLRSSIAKLGREAATWTGKGRGSRRPLAGAEQLLRGGDTFMKQQQKQLTRRRHVDLARISSSLCRGAARER
ncbi:putative leader peptide [Streptomyces decoyicus]|uniref:putative leader peptide n=1 Tax=Streptomyces decoyicus TaxID=249567 RepID=UPI0033A329A8